MLVMRIYKNNMLMSIERRPPHMVAVSGSYWQRRIAGAVNISNCWKNFRIKDMLLFE
jgi:hypothetical protein